MSNINVKQGCPLFPHSFGLYIDELETYLDKINKDSPCLTNMVVAIFHYVDDIILLSKFMSMATKDYEQTA